MPSFSKRYTDLAERGPDVFLTLARPLSIVVPPGSQSSDRMSDVRALIDTGATLCAIRTSLVGELGLQEFDFREFGNSTGKEWRPIYLIDLIFPNDGDQRRPVEAAGCQFSGQNIEFVIGRNFLTIAELKYNGPLGSYELSF